MFAQAEFALSSSSAQHQQTVVSFPPVVQSAFLYRQRAVLIELRRALPQIFRSPPCEYFVGWRSVLHIQSGRPQAQRGVGQPEPLAPGSSRPSSSSRNSGAFRPQLCAFEHALSLCPVGRLYACIEAPGFAWRLPADNRNNE